MDSVQKHWEELDAKMAARGTFLIAEKEKLQLLHEENEFREQLQVLQDRLNHFGPVEDENAGIRSEKPRSDCKLAVT